MIYNIQDNAKFTIKGRDGYHAKVAGGELTINVAKSIKIKGKGAGAITFEQSGGGFKIDPGGNIKIYGNAISLGGQGEVKFQGNVSYSIGSPSIPGSLKVATLSLNDIQELKPIQLRTARQAAVEGKPFCEICEQKAKERAAAAAANK